MFSKDKGTGGGSTPTPTGEITIVEVDAGPHNVAAADDITNCNGTFNVNLPNLVSAENRIYWIANISGTTTVLADATIDGIVTVSDGVRGFYRARGQWWQI